jgi:hypothetical protein
LLLRLLLKNQNISATMAIRPAAPKTPPTTGAAVSLGFEDIPEAAEDSPGFAVDANNEVDEVFVVFVGDWKPLSLLFPSPPIVTGVAEACTSLWAIGKGVVLEVVGVVPFEAGSAVALKLERGSTEDVLSTAAEALVAIEEVSVSWEL